MATTPQVRQSKARTDEDPEATREHLQRLIEQLPDEELQEAEHMLEGLLARHAQEDEALIEQWIRPHPSKGGPGEAVLAESYVPVHAVVAYLEAVHDDVGRAAQDYHLPLQAVEAALAYYRRYGGAVDARIAANQPPED